MRLEVRLADVRSVADVEGLVNRRTMRLWPGGQRSVRLQSDYSYRRQRPRWARVACSIDRHSFDSGSCQQFFRELAASEPERRHAELVRQERERLSVSDVIEHFRKASDVAPQEFLSAANLILSGQATVEEMARILQESFLPGLFTHFPAARLVFLSVDPEAEQRLGDLVVLHLYERQARDEVRKAVFDGGFFPQVQGGFAPVNLVASSLLALSGFFYPWLYFLPVARPSGVFLLFLNSAEPFNLGLEEPTVLEALTFGLGRIHGYTADRLTDLSRFMAAPPAASEVENLTFDVLERMNDLLVALYDIGGFPSPDEQLSACFTTARLCEELATGFLTTNPYLRKITFFNVWDKVTSVQSGRRSSLREVEVKRRLVQPERFRTEILSAIPETAPLRKILLERVFEQVVSTLLTTLQSGSAPWTAGRVRGNAERFLSEILVSYRNTIHGYGEERLPEYLSHAGLIPDSVLYLAFFWWLSLIYRPTAYLRGRWVS